LRPPVIYKGFLGHFDPHKRHRIKKDSQVKLNTYEPFFLLLYQAPETNALSI